jgi:hypothetical protein
MADNLPDIGDAIRQAGDPRLETVEFYKIGNPRPQRDPWAVDRAA